MPAFFGDLKDMNIQYFVVAVLLGLSSVGMALEQSAHQVEIERLYSGYSEQLAVPDVQAAEVLAQQGRLLVDVRTVAEQQVSMLPGAIDVQTYETMPKAARQNAVIYCTIGVRSGEYVAKLAELGIEATNLAGGLLSWTHAGGQLQRSDEVVEQAHVYGRRWRLLPEPYKAEWFWWVF